MPKSFLFLVLVFLSAFAPAQGSQQKPNPFVADIHYAAGKLSPMYPNFPKTSFTNVAEIFLGYQAYGNKPWHRLFNYPRLGLSFIYQDLGNRAIFGQQFSIVPTVYFSTAKKETAKVYAELRYGLGVACFTNVYDSLENPLNSAVSSVFTWQHTLGANLNWNINKYIGLQLGGVWYHASNAHTKLPNVGMNNFAIYTGILVYPFGKFSRNHEFDSIKIDRKWHVNFRVGAGWQQMGNAFGNKDKTKYPVYTVSIYTTRKLAKLITAKMGLIYRYYPMYKTFIEEHKVFDSKIALRSSAFIVFVGADLLLGHFAISLEAGVNVYKPAYKSFNDYYEKSSKFSYYTKRYLATRFGLNYYVLDPYKHPRNNVFLGAYVSANEGQAEFLEMNLGYVW